MTSLKKRKILLVVTLVLITIFFTIKSPYYLKPSNLLTILREASVLGIMAIGMTYVIITGGIDLSVGSVFAICSMLYVDLFYVMNLPAVPAILIVLVLSLGIGAVNGLLVTKVQLPDFIATLATMTVFRGLTTIIAPRDASGNVVSVNIKNKLFASLAEEIGPVHSVIIVFAVLCVIAHIILRYTKTGISIYATGANAKSASLSGIRTTRAKMFAYMFSALMAGIAATFYTARIRSATVDLGAGVETDVIAAVVVGGTLFAGGEGDILGVALGAIFLKALQNGLYKLDVSSAYDPIIVGCVIIAAIMMDSLLGKVKLPKGKSKTQTAKEVK